MANAALPAAAWFPAHCLVRAVSLITVANIFLGFARIGQGYEEVLDRVADPRVRDSVAFVKIASAVIWSLLQHRYEHM